MKAIFTTTLLLVLGSHGAYASDRQFMSQHGLQSLDEDMKFELEKRLVERTVWTDSGYHPLLELDSMSLALGLVHILQPLPPGARYRLRQFWNSEIDNNAIMRETLVEVLRVLPGETQGERWRFSFLLRGGLLLLGSVSRGKADAGKELCFGLPCSSTQSLRSSSEFGEGVWNKVPLSSKIEQLRVPLRPDLPGQEPLVQVAWKAENSLFQSMVAEYRGADWRENPVAEMVVDFRYGGIDGSSAIACNFSMKDDSVRSECHEYRSDQGGQGSLYTYYSCHRGRSDEGLCL